MPRILFRAGTLFWAGRSISAACIPNYRQPQVFDRRKFKYREDAVHEGFECSGSSGYFKNFIWQHPWPTLAVIFAKGERYSPSWRNAGFEQGRRGRIRPAAFQSARSVREKIHL